jgi:thiol:disulfide interchange protein
VACGVLLFSGYGLAMEWGLDWRQTRDDSIKWTAWSPEAEQKARSAGKPVLIDFTADWCITCKANKRTSIEIESVRAMLKEKGVVAMTGDYTNKDPRITKVLHDHRRSGVPLVLVYSPDENKPEVLPVMLTPQIVLDALEDTGKFSP